MNLCHVVNYTIYGHVRLEFQCYFKCIYLNLAVVNIVEGGIDMVDTTQEAMDVYLYNYHIFLIFYIIYPNFFCISSDFIFYNLLYELK